MLQAAPNIRFDGSDGPTHTTNPGNRMNTSVGDGEQGESIVWAHKSGVNYITIDKFEGR